MPSSPQPISSPEPLDLHAELERVFGYGEFRPHQEDAIRTALEGRDCLVVMPTGAGKSLTFQLPAAISEGTTIVLSPLIALMRDQVIALRERTAFAEMGAAYLNSSQSLDEQRDILTLLRAGKLKLLYIAPERLRSSAFIETIKNTKIARVVVDEAHCISEWGHDFRPDYLAIADVLSQLGDVPRFAVTATATLRVQQSIISNLGMKSPEVIVGGFNRPNLHFSVVRCKSDVERSNRLFKAIPKLLSRGGSGLIYVSTRRQCEELSDLVAQALAPMNQRVGCYHAGMESDVRSRNQEAWLRGEIPVLVATNAFGMGIDKPDVRFVIHWGFPESPESYYQEAGRAGRDGRKSRVVILSVGMADRKLREFFISNEELQAVELQDVVQKLGRLAAGEETVRVPRFWWDHELGWREPKPRVVLGKLERGGFIQRLNENIDGSVLKILKTSMTLPELRVAERGLEREKNERLARLDEMLAYVKSRGCRRRLLLDYFGDEDEAASDFCCDNCDAGNREVEMPAGSAEVAQGKVSPPDGMRDVYDLLQGIDSLWPAVGKGRLVKVLRGSNAEGTQRFAGHAIFGTCAGVSAPSLGAFVDELIEQGWIHQGDEDEYFVIRVTRAGRDAWEAHDGVDLELPGRARTSRIRSISPRAVAVQDFDDEMGEENSALFERLRMWRRQRAHEESVPPYVVFPDKVLREIARQAPETEDQLLCISGVGGRRAEKYAAALLQVIGTE